MKDFQDTPYWHFATAVGGLFEKARGKIAKKGAAFSYTEIIKKAGAFVIPAIFAAIFAQKELPFSTYPLGLALCAAGSIETLSFAAGVLVAAAVSGNIPLAAGLVSLVILRFVFSKLFVADSPLSVKTKLSEKIKSNTPKPFFESATLRLCVSALAAFTMGMMKIVAGGFSVGDLVGTCFCTALCPCLTYLYYGCFASGERKSMRYEFGISALLATFVFALSALPPQGISFSVIVASFISFIMARRKNPLPACLFSLLAIMAAEPMLSPAFAISAVVAALLYARSRLYAVCTGSICFAAISYFTGGVSLFAAAFPEFLFGAVVSSFISDDIAKKLLPFPRTQTISVAESEILGYKEQNGRDTIKDISASFESLSKTFFDLSDANTRIGIFDTRQICDSVCDRFCKRCSACTLCWERDYSVTLDTLNKISAKLYKSGEVSKDDLPPEFLARCRNADKMLKEIERENARSLRQLLREDKSRAFAVDYAVFAKVLSEALRKNEAEYRPNLPLRKKVVSALEGIGFSADSIGVYGTRSPNIYAFRLSSGAMKCSAETITKTVSDALCGRIEEPVFEFSDGGINMICKSAPRFRAESTVFSLSAEASEENGDRVISFEGKNGYFYTVVSDGMGSGASAARKSRAAGIFLEKMLRAGNSVSSSIEMLAAFARADGEEVFTTLDLFELDSVSGKCAFVKSGAAPSFVKRGERIFKIRSKTFPLGIMEDVDAEKTAFDCEDGDDVVILSDGVTEDIEEPAWLCEFLLATDLSAQASAEKIVSEAKKHTLCRDDMTAAVVHIKKV